MKTVFNFIFGIVAALAVGGSSRADAPATLQRLAALADYVAADYAGAVQHGRVVAASEYEEQRGLIADARGLLSSVAPLGGHAGAGAALARELEQLAQKVEARADEREVVLACRAIHHRLVEDFGLVLTPLAPPSIERARALFKTACASCHGDGGRADTEQARTLKPPPVSFFDDERMTRISPSLAFHALTFGVPNTSMAAFDTLPASDRWSLAFYVVGLRHARPNAPPLQPGTLDAVRATLATTPSRLAQLSDGEIDELVRADLPDAAVRARLVDHLRTVAPYQSAHGEFEAARRMLAELGQAAGDRGRARELAIAAYLEGVEPHEATLRARDPELAARIEQAFFDLRRAIDRKTKTGDLDVEAVRREVARATMILDGAEERARGGSGPGVPFAAALTIALREGFEASLLIAALLAFVRKSGRARQARYVHAGWMAAVPAGLGTWFLVGAALAGARRELTEGILTLVAAAMLLAVNHLVLGKLESRRWLRFLERRTRAPQRGRLASERFPWPLLALAFIAAYREAIEIVLFFRALVLDSPMHKGAIALGAAAGASALAIVVFVMGRVGRRLNPRPVMLASSLVLTLLGISLVGHGVRALQEGGYLRLTPLDLPSAPSIGLYATVEGLALQAVVLALVIVPSWLGRRRARRADAAKLA